MALQALYEADATGHDAASSLAWHSEDALPDSVAGFAMRLVQGVLENRQELDQHIRRYAPAWPIEQIAAIDRCILRLALYELLFVEETPPKVAISEAVELAKRFGGENSPKFVNGVLGSVMADRHPAADS